MKYEDLIKNLCGMILKFTPLTLIHLLMNKSLLYFMQIFIYTKCKTYFSSRSGSVKTHAFILDQEINVILFHSHKLLVDATYSKQNNY